MIPLRIALLLALQTQANQQLSNPNPDSDTRAALWLQDRVRRWEPENGCFSCHHHGDALRAILALEPEPRPELARELRPALRWLADPEAWPENKGDPVVSDLVLARVQFTAALAAWLRDAPRLEPDLAPEPQTLDRAVRLLVEDQNPDGAWTQPPPGLLPTPAGLGRELATAMAVEALATLAPRTRDPQTRNAANHALERARRWAINNEPRPATPEIAARILILRPVADLHAPPDPNHLPHLEKWARALLETRSPAGAWGPFRDTPEEPFDTALAILALQRTPNPPENPIQTARARLRAIQNPDGHWTETTRPPRGESYPHRVSTTAWALLALIESDPETKSAPKPGKNPDPEPKSQP